MKVFQNLTIDGWTANVSKFLDGFPDASTGWIRNEEKGGRLPDYVAIDVPKRPELCDATVYLHISQDNAACSLTNIIPKGNDLSPEEYNKIVRVFYEECVSERAKQFGVDVDLSASEIHLEDSLTEPTMALLRSFSRLANKSNAASHPNDRERWLKYLAVSLVEGERADRELLEDWLIEDGWPDEIARELGHEYEFADELIGTIRAEKESVGAA
jgi:hypothetical protein